MIFLFKQKTAYEMRISDWSSDVCSSDLIRSLPPEPEGGLGLLRRLLNLVGKWLPGEDNFPLYREAPEQRASDYGEVTGALAGHSPGMVGLNGQGRLVLSVAVPVQRYRRARAALMLSKDATEVYPAADDPRPEVLIVCGVPIAATSHLAF